LLSLACLILSLLVGIKWLVILYLRVIIVALVVIFALIVSRFIHKNLGMDHMFLW
jgi:hypothetical protein